MHQRNLKSRNCVINMHQNAHLSYVISMDQKKYKNQKMRDNSIFMINNGFADKLC